MTLSEMTISPGNKEVKSMGGATVKEHAVASYTAEKAYKT